MTVKKICVCYTFDCISFLCEIQRTYDRAQIKSRKKNKNIAKYNNSIEKKKKQQQQKDEREKKTTKSKITNSNKLDNFILSNTLKLTLSVSG